ncbi:MAG TPA: CocE/NonD family hydrolase C-terminal non-catalytic domain-containing protein [Pyrinomonadaceae bacterium]
MRPKPLRLNSRELELSLNEAYRTADSERKDLVTYTTAPLEKDTEITGPMAATLWAVTEGKTPTGAKLIMSLLRIETG